MSHHHQLIENMKRNNQFAEDFMRLMESPLHEPSIYIHRVTPEITEDQIRDVFHGLQLGDISRVELVKCKNEKENSCQAFIHFNEWNWDENSTYVRKLLLRGEDMFVRYEGFNNWKVTMNRSNKRVHHVRPYKPNKLKAQRPPLACAKNKVNQWEPLEEGEEIYVH